MGPSGEVRIARAFAPGHVTGFFRPELAARDPRGRGSTGAGIVLDRGVVATARWWPDGPDRLRLRSRPKVPLPISRSVATRLRAGHGGSLEVSLEHALPVGQGLGMSAAGAVATGLAVAEALGASASRAWQWAHLVELERLGGLGGVSAIGAGGLELRDRPGIPPWGSVRHRPCRAELALVPCGAPLPSPGILSDRPRTDRLRRLGSAALRRYRSSPGLRRFLEESERFTDGAGLLPARGRALADRLRSPEIAVVQAMFGRMILLAPRAGGALDLPEGLPARTMRVRAGDHGARLEREPSRAWRERRTPTGPVR